MQRPFPCQLSVPPCASRLFLLLLKSFWQQGQDMFSLSSSDSFFPNIAQFHMLNQFCIINVHFLPDSIFTVLCFLIAGLQLCFKQVVHLADVCFFQIIILCSLSINFNTSLLQDFNGNVLLDELDNTIRLNRCFKKMWVIIWKWIKYLHTVTLNIQGKKHFLRFSSEI